MNRINQSTIEFHSATLLEVLTPELREFGHHCSVDDVCNVHDISEHSVLAFDWTMRCCVCRN